MWDETPRKKTSSRKSEKLWVFESRWVYSIFISQANVGSVTGLFGSGCTNVRENFRRPLTRRNRIELTWLLTPIGIQGTKTAEVELVHQILVVIRFLSPHLNGKWKPWGGIGSLTCRIGAPHSDLRADGHNNCLRRFADKRWLNWSRTGSAPTNRHWRNT